MQRRTLLQWLAAVPALLPLQPLRLLAQPRELTPDAIAELHEIAPTVLPSTLGDKRRPQRDRQICGVDARLSRRRAR